MEKYKTIEEEFENKEGKEVVKQTRISFVALGLMIAAVVCVVVARMFEDPNSSMPSLLYTLAAFVFLGGIIKFFVSRSCYVFLPTRSPLKSFVYYYDVHESTALQACIEMKQFDGLGSLKREKDTGVRLEGMMTADGKFVAVQIAEYVPYTYEAITPVIRYYNEDAQKLFTYFTK